MENFKPEKIREKLLRARKVGESKDWALIGKADGDANPYSAQDDTGLNNVVYGRVNGQVDPTILYYPPELNAALLTYNMAVEIEWRNNKPWIVRSQYETVVDQLGGASLPTNMSDMKHDHTSTSQGGSLGAGTVDTSQLVAESVTLPKIVRLGNGSLFVGNGAGADVSELTAGTEGQVLTITSGVPAWEDASTISTPVTVPNGGTGRTSVTANSLLVGNGTSALNIITPTIVGSIPVLTGGGLTFSNSPTIGSITTQGGAVFNENGIGTSDIRMESDNNTHQFFIDTSLDALGINESAPDANSALTITADANDAPLQMTPAATPTNLSNGQVWQDSDRNAIGTRINGRTMYAPNTHFSQYGSASTTSTSFTDLLTGSSIGSVTILANTLKVGKLIRLEVQGFITGDNTSSINMTFKSQIQSNSIATSPNVPIASTITYLFKCTVDYVCTATGATNTLRGFIDLELLQSNTMHGTPAAPVPIRWRATNSLNVNTASDAAITFEAAWASTPTGGTCSVRLASIDLYH